MGAVYWIVGKEIINSYRILRVSQETTGFRLQILWQFEKLSRLQHGLYSMELVNILGGEMFLTTSEY